MGRHPGLARNAVWGTSGDLEVVCNEAVLSRGRGSSFQIVGVKNTAASEQT